MNNDLKEWLVQNRHSDGLAALFYHLDEQIRQMQLVTISKVRDDECAKVQCGKYYALCELKSFLQQPLTETDTGRDT